MAGTNGFVPLRRGILEHLGGMTGLEVKVYDALLCLARPSSGEVHISARDLAEMLETRHQSVSKALHDLSGPHGPKDTRYIDYEPAHNQHSLGAIHIIKYPVRGGAFSEPADAPATEPARGQQGDSKGTARGQHTGSEQGEGDPNSLESHKSLESQGQAAPVFTAIETATGSILSSADQATIAGWIRSFPEPLILEAISRAAAKGKARVPYIGGIITGLAEDGWEPKKRSAALSVRDSLPCPECRGSGDSYDDGDNLVPCPRCKGAGRVARAAS